MNVKTKTLIIAFLTISVIIFVSKDITSISASLGLISFIMICHFYLNRHHEDISNILKEQQDNVFYYFNITDRTSQQSQKLNKPPIQLIDQVEQQFNLQQPQIDPNECIQEDSIIESYRQQYVQNQLKSRPKLTYLFEDNRIQQLIDRQRPNKDIQKRMNLLKNRDYFKQIFNDEIEFNIQRAGWWDSENIEDEDVCQ